MIMALVGGCLRRILVLTVVGVIVVIAWQHRGAVSRTVRNYMTAESPAEPSLQIALQVETLLAALAGPHPPERIALSQLDLQSLARFRGTAYLPAYFQAPTVELARGNVRFEARLPTDLLPWVAELAELRSFLPDTTELAVTGQVLPWADGLVALVVSDFTLTQGRIPVPRRYLPGMLERLGRTDEPGLPPNAIVLQLPAGARAAFVHGDSLILLGADTPPG